MIRVLTIIGARPQIIKAAAISRAIRNHFRDKIHEIIVHTGQHYDENMSGVFINELSIPTADYNLEVGSSTHGKQTATMLMGIEEILLKEKPDALIIYGDTNSTIAGGIAAAKLHIPVVHIEAGLRSFNKLMPEEINRICCDHVSTLLFSPTKTAIKNLQKEGFNTLSVPPYSIDNPGIFHCGDIMYDNSLHFAAIAKEKSAIIKNLGLIEGTFILSTVHRDLNTDDSTNLNNLFSAFNSISAENKIQIVIPLHPRTRKMMDTLLDKQLYTEIQNNLYLKIIPPLSFLEVTLLESSCSMIMTDSGGVQKEAYFFNKPCLILRDETEWVELVENGCARLTGTSPDKIKEAFKYFNNNKSLKFPQVFGDGKAAEFICSKIVEILEK